MTDNKQVVVDNQDLEITDAMSFLFSVYYIYGIPVYMAVEIDLQRMCTYLSWHLNLRKVSISLRYLGHVTHLIKFAISCTINAFTMCMAPHSLYI